MATRILSLQPHSLPSPTRIARRWKAEHKSRPPNAGGTGPKVTFSQLEDGDTDRARTGLPAESASTPPAGDAPKSREVPDPQPLTTPRGRSRASPARSQVATTSSTSL